MIFRPRFSWRSLKLTKKIVVPIVPGGSPLLWGNADSTAQHFSQVRMQS